MAHPTTHNVYVGIFAKESGQQLLDMCIEQIQSTMCAAWTLCEPKEDPVSVYLRCLDTIDGWNEKTFQQEAEMSFLAHPRAELVWGSCFESYVMQTYEGMGTDKNPVRATVPKATVFVQSLIEHAAKNEYVRSPRSFFGSATNHKLAEIGTLERDRIVMSIVRASLVALCNDFVYVSTDENGEGEDEPVSEAADGSQAGGAPDGAPDDAPDGTLDSAPDESTVVATTVSPSDSASQVGSRRSRVSIDRADHHDDRRHNHTGHGHHRRHSEERHRSPHHERGHHSSRHERHRSHSPHKSRHSDGSRSPKRDRHRGTHSRSPSSRGRSDRSSDSSSTAVSDGSTFTPSDEKAVTLLTSRHR